MDFLTFLETHRKQWPLGKMQTLHQAHHVALGSPLTHTLQDSDFLRTASFIQITICKPRSHTLPLSEIREFTQKIIAIAPRDCLFDLEVGKSDSLEDSIMVRILAAQIHD